LRIAWKIYNPVAFYVSSDFGRVTRAFAPFERRVLFCVCRRRICSPTLVFIFPTGDFQKRFEMFGVGLHWSSNAVMKTEKFIVSKISRNIRQSYVRFERTDGVKKKKKNWNAGEKSNPFRFTLITTIFPPPPEKNIRPNRLREFDENTVLLARKSNALSEHYVYRLFLTFFFFVRRTSLSNTNSLKPTRSLATNNNNDHVRKFLFVENV